MSTSSHIAHLTSVADLTPLLDTLSVQLSWSDKARFQIELALEELIVNTFTHGISNRPAEQLQAVLIDVSFQQADKELTITLKDNADAFDPTQFAAPDITLSVEDRKIGGLGLFLTSKMMDDIQYRRDGSFNYVHLRKQLT